MTRRKQTAAQGDCWRFSLLTSRILRLEYDADGVFEDRPSQVVQNRPQAPEGFCVYETAGQVEIVSEHFTLYYTGGPFTANTLWIDARNDYTNYGARWRYGQSTYGEPPRHHNLYGTVRTLDKLDGACALDFGMMDTSGHAVLDDSASALVEENGALTPRRKGVVDLYYIYCGHEYRETLRDFFRLTGRPPLLPRWAFGNWWSRYHAYSAESYLELLARFEEKKLPFTVSVLDMDWHTTKRPNASARGWTGYTWNRELFPAPRGFAEKVHGRGMRLALNLHPADGVDPWEDSYDALAAALGREGEDRRTIPFACEPRFLSAYFEHVIAPLEAEGTDFFWIDWQQGRSSESGVDPLWVLNDSFYRRSCEKRGRGIILSRYAGMGSHRFPVGFSGDTVTTWASLDFQPYFTSTAGNCGYGVWSHDIGGFKTGIRSGELYLRWLQWGVFSPVMRLHCSNNPFCRKEPWTFDHEVERIAGEWLRLRHRLIPYLYSAHAACAEKGGVLLEPMYYAYPACKEAYGVKNQYMLTDQLTVCPVTTPCAEQTGMGQVKAWIPPGAWTDVLTGQTYEGPCMAVLNRSLETMPVLARAGAIVPVDGREDAGNSVENPDVLEIHVFDGASGCFELYEDAGDGAPGDAARTCFVWTHEGNQGVMTTTVHGNKELLPDHRRYRLVIHNTAAEGMQGSVNAQMFARGRNWVVECEPGLEITVTLQGLTTVKGKPLEETVFDCLMTCSLPIETKMEIQRLYQKPMRLHQRLSSLHALGLEPAVMDLLMEITLQDATWM